MNPISDPPVVKNMELTKYDKTLLQYIDVFTSFSSIVKDDHSLFKEKVVNIWLKLWEVCSFSETTRANAKKRLQTCVIFQRTHNDPKSQIGHMIRESRDRKSVHFLDGAKPLSEPVIRHEPALLIQPEPIPSTQPKVKVTNADVTVAALDAHANHKNVAIIDLASAVNVCGAFLLPNKGTQEEKIAETAPLIDFLDRNLNKQLKELRPPNKFKTFIPEKGCLYLPQLPFIRNQDSSINTSGTLPLINVIAVAALDGRDKNIRKQYFEEDGANLNKDGKEITKEKMRAVIRIANKNKIDYLILGALGCGAYRNPPETIARLWKEVINESEFSNGHLKEIEFAIYTSPRPRDQANLEAFKKEFPEPPQEINPGMDQTHTENKSQ